MVYSEALVQAIQMEIDGKNYYEKQADLNKNNRLSVVFTLLAKHEQKHADILLNMSQGTQYVQVDQNSVKLTDFFTDLKDYKNEVFKIPKQLEVYRIALDMEEKSIRLYKEQFEIATKKEVKDLFSFLIEQESEHYDLFLELEKLISRPEEWIESAEFGLRDEY